MTRAALTLARKIIIVSATIAAAAETGGGCAPLRPQRANPQPPVGREGAADGDGAAGTPPVAPKEPDPELD